MAIRVLDRKTPEIYVTDLANPLSSRQETLPKEFADSAQEVGMACCDYTCNNPLLQDFAQAVLLLFPAWHSRPTL